MGQNDKGTWLDLPVQENWLPSGIPAGPLPHSPVEPPELLTSLYWQM